MQIRDLPHPDPGVPDVRTGDSFLRWLYAQQLGGQLKALAWGLVNFGAIASFPLPVGMAVQAAVDRDGGRLALSGGLMLVLGALIALGGTMLHRAAVTNWITTVARMQQLLARKTTELGSAMTRQVAAGEIVAVSTGDLEKIGWFVESISRFGAAAVTAVAVAAALVVREPHLGTLVALGVPVLALAVLPLLPPAARRADAQREVAGRATELASDTVAGLRVLRGIGGEELFLGRYRAASQEVRRAAVRSARMWSLIAAVQVVLPGLLLIAVVWYGTRLALDGTVAVGELVMIYSAVTFLLLPLRHFEEIAQALSFARPSARRTARVLAQHRPAGGRTADDQAPPSGDLHDPVSGLTAPAGQLTAVVCGDPDAAGRLAERLGGHAHGAGQGLPPVTLGGTPPVTLGGTPLDDLPRDAARAAVLVQDKDPMLLSGTLGELLDVPSSGRLAADEALTAAQCGDVLTALGQASLDGSGDPMRTHITERGRSLSGGQRQRLALARSLVTDPEVLVLDEPTSAVDAHTEARIADGLREIRSGRTTVVLTSSPLLLDRADRVAFLHEGKVIAEAPHRELLHSHPAYRAVVTRETEPEAAREREREAARDGEPEAARETEPEVARDGAREALRETEPEAARDGQREAARETKPEAARNGQREATRQTKPGATRDTAPEGARDTTTETEAAPETDLAAEATPNKNPERVLTTAQADETA
ncbi:ABC transporter transmembrane domain-containing protein [Streptomyces endophytica]|uniref:ABC transporter ATP-binding protein/permease n=1 Tax=Streptomyces endophytica TaxID=2991496 RepID=A0ABY6PI32_9ACTN|nr:ABC transporter ATP-binding protein [Streptomyces endophytica]UZJ33197.1 ABC transporter ATP-binding protein/permease [Streptomyces endophytica]